MTDVLLASANYMALDSKQLRKRRPYPPLATLYAASTLRQAGLSVSVFDATLAPSEEAFFSHLAGARPRIVTLYEDNFNFLSKMCLGRMREAAQAMARASREAGARVLAAGPDVTDRPALYLDHGVDYALVGEPDHTLVELARILLGRQAGDPETVAGIAVTGGGPAEPVRRTVPRPPERDPDVFPPPAWDLVDLEAYRSVWLEAHGRFSLNLATTRGCPFHCNWCAKPIWGQRYAIHSPGRVAEEMAHLKRQFRPDHVWFADDIFGLRPAWVVDFARELGARGGRLPFTVQTRADLLTPESVRALADAGCEDVWLGAESGSQRILDAMEKGTTVDDVVTARWRLAEAGIRANFFLQFGYPGETFHDILATVRLVRDLLPDDIGISVAYPLPGTRFYDRVREELGRKTNWTDSDDLEMLFRGPYQTALYRRLHGLLHDELTIRLAMARGTASAADLEVVLAEWERLEAAERDLRTDAPVRLHTPTASARPDLSRDWN
jgi:anaerobic magnesium-protoporphyrin IX monomethyl ester cyclase